MFKACLFIFHSLSLKFAWASTNPNKLKKLNSQQKHAARIICNEGRYTHAKPLMTKLNILNVH